jgi:hypothetical protein
VEDRGRPWGAAGRWEREKVKKGRSELGKGVRTGGMGGWGRGGAGRRAEGKVEDSRGRDGVGVKKETSQSGNERKSKSWCQAVIACQCHLPTTVSHS